MAAFQHLFTPGRIGSLELKNRILMAPMGSNMAESTGHCGERIQAFYEARAKGGAGMLTMGVGSIAYPAGTAEPYQVGISSDDFIPGLKQLTDRVHKHGSKIAIQLQHAGKTSVRDLAEGRELWVPSMPPAANTDMFAALTQSELGRFISSSKGREKGGVRIRVMDKDDIRQMVSWFADAAERAQKAGFDGIEIHAGHTYIISGFLSPYYNTRDDEYGGPLENRARLLLEVIAAVRERVGQDYPVWMRMDAIELDLPGGISLKDATLTAKMAQDAGIDLISVSAYANLKNGNAFTQAPIPHDRARFLEWAAHIRQHIDIPVTAAGRLDPEVADKAIEDGKCDFVAMGRKLLADPDLPNKLSENRAADVRPCIYCYACVSQIFVNERVKCAVNPQTGHESELQLIASDSPKKVLVVGGGPAGLEAARVSALLGHQVTLVERSGRLGGTLFFAALAYPENGPLLDYLIKQVRDLPIDVRLNTNADEVLVKELNPDKVILAVGARRNAPDIPGADQKHVWSGDELRKLMTGEGADIAKRKLSVTQRVMMKSGSLVGVTNSTEAIQSLSKLWMPLGKKVAIIGGGLVGLELAEFLVERGREVQVLEPGPDLGAELSIVRRWRVLHNLESHGVRMEKNTQIHTIGKKTLSYTDAEGKGHELDADSVVLAVGAETNNCLSHSLEKHGIDVINIGDGAEVAYIEGALRSGIKAGLSL